jgi:hypothetical protein
MLCGSSQVLQQLLNHFRKSRDKVLLFSFSTKVSSIPSVSQFGQPQLLGRKQGTLAYSHIFCLIHTVTITNSDEASDRA